MKSLRATGIIVAAVLVVLLLLVVVPALSWLHMSSQLAMARSRGVYPSAEQAMLALVDQGYVAIARVDILYAGPNSFDGSQPHIWYVIVEVRADRRADGSAMGRNGCDAPGSYFLHTRDGWIHVPEGAFPEVIGFLMGVFGQAGPGQPQPSTDWAPSQPARFCQAG